MSHPSGQQGIEERCPLPHLTCARCGRTVLPGRMFRFKGQAIAGQPGNVAGVTKCTRCAVRHRPMLKRSLAASLVVGTILTLLNQGDALLSGAWSSALYWKIPLTYCVPFLVATYGALTNSRQ